MTRTGNTTGTLPARSREGGEYIHIVSAVQWLLDLLRLKIPRALCGASLIGDPDKPDPGFNAPTCPRCSEKC